jgi:dipeptidyl aminopeptidase/acylaminoacyl peptidase
MRVTLVGAFLSLAVTNTRAKGLEGIWKGSWTKDGDALSVIVTFDKSSTGYSGSFDSNLLQVAGIPFSSVEDTNGKVHFLLKGDQSTTVFNGWLTGDTMAGTFTDGSAKGTFELTRATFSAAGIRTRDVTFPNKDVTLAGTLLLPGTQGRHAATLFLQGSGPEGRWANHYLAQKFAESGITALIYDKRGVGQSTGNWKTVGFDALADDAVAGIRFLQSQPEIDSSRVGIYGHSQGGTISPLIATRAKDLRFVIASAASGISPADCEVYSVENSMGVSRLPVTERADAQNYVRELVNVAYHGNSREPLDAMSVRFKARAWFFEPPRTDNSFWTIARLTAGFNPPNHWRQVRAPVLLVYGAHDERVPPTLSAKVIQAALKEGGNRQVSLRVFANADHAFVIVDPPHQTGWSLHVPDYAEILTSWVLSLK